MESFKHLYMCIFLEDLHIYIQNAKEVFVYFYIANHYTKMRKTSWMPYLANDLYPPLALICTLVTVYNTNPVCRSPPRHLPPFTPAGSSFARPAPSPPPPNATLSYAPTLSSTPSARRRTERP